MSRTPEPRIVDPATHPKRYVCLTVAAKFLETDRRTLNGWLDAGRLAWVESGKNRKKILVAELVRFERQRQAYGRTG